MSKNLVIVESPAKAKTIKKFLGTDFEVKSSYGHIRDLPKKDMNIDIENNFTPHYQISPDKKKVVSELKKAAKNSTIWLASDEDREGEAIAWHLCHALGIDPTTTKRIVFHEITKTAIDAAVQNPRTVNMQLVDAQQARRVLDRIVGYKLSPVLWKKIRPGLSAGRVQSVAVRLIVEREREIDAFSPVSSFKVTAEFSTKDGHTLQAELKNKLPTEKDATELLENLKSASYSATNITKKPSKRNPSAPFTTSSLQQEAARRLHFTVAQTMSVAQKLYESGHITYMRTDSTSLAKDAISAASTFITKEYGKDYLMARNYKTKQQSAQEAHEAIRPTRLDSPSAGNTDAERKLYELIWKRTLASQMSAAETDKTTIDIEPNQSTGGTVIFQAKGEILTFDGFMKVYGGGKEDTLLPELHKDDPLEASTITAEETFTKPPARYSEASLVKQLEDLGIGRPSTYAPTISTIQARGYVEKADVEGAERPHTIITLKDNELKTSSEERTFGTDKSKLMPTSLALVTTDFLTKHFPTIVDYSFTATVEGRFDAIALGKEQWVNMIDDFYKKFEPLVADSEHISRQESSQARKLGEDPKTGQPIYVRFGKYGFMLQRGETESDEKPNFAPMPEGKSIDTVTLEDALEMFTLPRIVGQTEDGIDIQANIGRFGPYIKINSLYVSIKPLDPFKITIEEARELYAKKLQQEKDKYIKVFDSGIQVINGPYGPYITDKKKNARIPKSVEPSDITEKQAKELLTKAPKKKKKYKKR